VGGWGGGVLGGFLVVFGGVVGVWVVWGGGGLGVRGGLGGERARSRQLLRRAFSRRFLNKRKKLKGGWEQ